MNQRTQHGFTLWELLTSLLVAGVLLGFGMPSFMELQRNNAMVSVANELVTGLLSARAEAVKRQVPVTLCASPDPLAAAPVCSPTGAGTNGGFIVWVDENGNVDANGSPILTDATDGNAALDAGELIVMRAPPPDPNGTINVSADSGYVAFAPNGFPQTAAGVANPPATTVLYCDERGNRPASGGSSARVVRIEATGRGQVLRDIPAVTAAVATIGAAANCP